MTLRPRARVRCSSNSRRPEPPDDRTLYLLSQAQRRSRDLAAAEATARRVIALDPNGLWGAWALAQVLEDRRDYTGVVTTLSAALSDSSTRERPPSRQTSVMLTHLAFAQLQLGQHEDAASTFTKAKEVSGGDDTFDLYLAQAYVSARRFDQALNVLRPLRDKYPGRPPRTARSACACGQRPPRRCDCDAASPHRR